MERWLHELTLIGLGRRFGLHDLLEDRRLRVVAGSPARKALLQRLLEAAGFEVVQSPYLYVDGIVSDGTPVRAVVPVLDVSASANFSAFLLSLDRLLTAPAALARRPALRLNRR